MAGTSQHGKAFIRPKTKAHLLIIEARFHDDLADALLDGATSRSMKLTRLTTSSPFQALWKFLP